MAEIPQQIDTANWDIDDANEPLDPALDDVDKEGLKAQITERYSQDTNWRKIFSIWVVCVDSLWLAVVLVIVFFQGFNLISLSDTILLTLLATTTLNVLGLAYIVLEGLFGKLSHNTVHHK